MFKGFSSLLHLIVPLAPLCKGFFPEDKEAKDRFACLALQSQSQNIPTSYV